MCSQDILHGLLVVLVIIFMSRVLNFNCTSGFFGGSQMTKIKNALVEKGWQLYTISTCGFCHDQLAILEGSYGAHTVCDGGACSDVRAYPTWINAKTGQRVEGRQTQAGLERMAF